MSLGTKLRRHVWERERGACCICRFPVAFEHSSIEHVNPLSKGGGRYGTINRRISHVWCNNGRNSGPMAPTDESLARTKRAYHRHQNLTWYPGTEPPYGKHNLAAKWEWAR